MKDNQQPDFDGEVILVGHFSGTSAEFWMNLQKLSALRLAEQEAGENINTLPTLAESIKTARAERLPHGR